MMTGGRCGFHSRTQQFLDVFGAYNSTAWPFVDRSLACNLCIRRAPRARPGAECHAQRPRRRSLGLVRARVSRVVLHGYQSRRLVVCRRVSAGGVRIRMVRNGSPHAGVRVGPHGASRGGGRFIRVLTRLSISGAGVGPRCSPGATLCRPLSNDTLYGGAAAHRCSSGSGCSSSSFL